MKVLMDSCVNGVLELIKKQIVDVSESVGRRAKVRYYIHHIRS